MKRPLTRRRANRARPPDRAVSAPRPFGAGTSTPKPPAEPITALMRSSPRPAAWEFVPALFTRVILNALLAVLMLLDLLVGLFDATVNAVRAALGRDETPTRLMRQWAR